MKTRKQTLCWAWLLLAAWSAIALLAIPSHAAYTEDDLMREVIEEDQHHYNDHYAQEDEPPPRQQQSQAEQEENARRKAAQENLDRVAAERERRFQAELDRISDEEQRKLALKQKRRDGRRVRSVLRASKRQDLYGVLGIRNWTLQFPSLKVNLAGFAKFTIPGLKVLGGATDQQIKKAFRQRAKQVHPDKNKDGRANEAFLAVQEAAGVLTDPNLRQQYDADRKAHLQDTMESRKQLVATHVGSVLGVLRKLIKVAQTILGPFFVPVAILGALII